MAGAFQLEQFRMKWKEELKHRGQLKHDMNSSKTVVTSNVSELLAGSSKSSSVQKSYFDSTNVDESEVTMQEKEPVNNSERTEYYPFTIVKGLLNDSRNKSNGMDSRKRKSIDRDVSYCENVAKQIRKPETSCHLKKMKLTDFKDLFSRIWSKQEETEPEQTSLLDKLIADIDEITEIPFFDISLPREIAMKIFQFLSMSDLCHCAQVSQSWKVIAEDELLWCSLCHRLGQEAVYTTREKTDWKQIVKHNVERKRLLELNWKGRNGRLTQLEHHQGKVLCAVVSHGDQVIAGYTSGDVKLWNLSTGDSCIYSPSSTALMVVEDDANTLRYNFVESVVLSDTVAAASYSQGNVDIWNLGAKTQPVQTYTASTTDKTPPTLCLSGDGSSLCVSQGTRLDLLYRNKLDDEFRVVQQLTSSNKFTHVKFKDNSATNTPCILYCEGPSVKIFKPAEPDSFGSETHWTEIHNTIGAYVDVVDYKGDVLGVGVGSHFDFGDRYKITLYDLNTGKCKQALYGHTWTVTCINMLDCPEHELVTGSADRRVRVYDMRMPDPVQTFIRHLNSVTTVQMDDWKVVSGAYDGFMCLFDRRMGRELWDFHNRHPVKHCRFRDKNLVVANVPGEKFPPECDAFETTMQRRYRGSINVYDFLSDMTTKDVPEICLSTYEEPDASRYNISLAMPYDTLQF